MGEWYERVGESNRIVSECELSVCVRTPECCLLDRKRTQGAVDGHSQWYIEWSQIVGLWGPVAMTAAAPPLPRLLLQDTSLHCFGLQQQRGIALLGHP